MWRPRSALLGSSPLGWRLWPTLLEILPSVASLANLAEDATVDVASSAVAEVASSAERAEVASSADLAGDMTVSVLSPADPASVVTAGVTFREECGDGVGVLCDYNCVCDEFTEAASLAKHVGGVPIAWTPIRIVC